MKNTWKKKRAAARRLLYGGLCVLSAGALLFGSAGCTAAEAEELTAGLTSRTVVGKDPDETFIASAAGFSLSLFREAMADEGNTLVSPLSVMLALAMTANGAAGETRAQMETLLGGGIPLDTLNEYLAAYVRTLPSGDQGKLSVANSLWFIDDGDRFQVEQDFLQKNADYYRAAAFKVPFGDQTVQDINQWVKTHTDGMVEDILKGISENAVMILVNALAFDAQWETAYGENDVRQGNFAAADGKTQTVEMMASDESLYLNDGNAAGFLKPYRGGQYLFAALLPGEGISVDDYVAGLTGERFLKILDGAETASVQALLPKFRSEYDIRLNDVLTSLGMPLAFDGGAADFTKLGRSTRGNIYMAEVQHKTYIAVDERGTKAGAATKVEMWDTAMMQGYAVVLDRPFVYAIVDSATHLPILIGTVKSVAG